MGLFLTGRFTVVHRNSLARAGDKTKMIQIASLQDAAQSYHEIINIGEIASLQDVSQSGLSILCRGHVTNKAINAITSHK